jgi:two-component system nitrate/nitrite response regulator NarL
MSGITLARTEPPPHVTLRLLDARRERDLRRTLSAAPEADAEVLVLELRNGDPVPEDAAAFDGALLVLSDDPGHAADPALHGVLPRGAPERQILAAVAAIAAGLTVRASAMREAIGFAPREAPGRAALTPREVEVLALVGEGLSNKAIARRLTISAHTVKYHLEAIFAKLGVRSRAEAVTRGLRLGVHLL